MPYRASDPAMAAGAIPLTVIAGYFGAGKTTLLAHLLRHSHARRIAVLVNDLGGAGIDESLIRSRGSCIRCPSSADAAEMLAALRRRSGLPQHVLVEASGLGDAQLIAQCALLPGYALDGVIHVADAEAIHSQVCSPSIGPRILGQLWTADLIVLNKTDLLSPLQREAVRDWLCEAIPDARVVECSYGRLPPALLLGRHPPDEARPERRQEGHARVMVRLPQELAYASWTWSGNEVLEAAAFRWWAGRLPPGIVRAKGILRLQHDMGTRFVFDLIGHRWSLRPDGPWRERPRTVISVLGRAGSFVPQLLEITIRQSSIRHSHQA